MNPNQKSVSNQVLAVGRTIGVLKFAVNQTKPFQVSDVAKSANDVNSFTVLRYIKTLIELGYIEKTTCFKYQATSLAKELINVSH